MEQQYQRTVTEPGQQRMVTPKAENLTFQTREALNILRGNIQLSGYDIKVIAVTSTVPNEGKSSISFYLARSFANLGALTSSLGLGATAPVKIMSISGRSVL